MSEKKTVHCNFCTKGSKDVKKLIAGQDVHICDECVQICHQIINEDSIPTNKTGEIPSPRKIKEFLDLYVVGQEYAKETISVAVHNHYKRLANPIIGDIEIEKSNVLLMGPTGSGKTQIARTIARFLDVPFAIADATSLTEAGYVGDDVESIISKLIQAADGDATKAAKGIIYIDEIDKLARRGDSASLTRDVGGEGVQQALLKVLEGTICRVPPQGGRKHPNQEVVEVDTGNILFIVGGAFVGIDKIIEDRLNKKTGIGFGADVKSKDENVDFKVLEKLEPRDLHKFGMIPEFVGRIPVKTSLLELNKEQLVKVLTETKNSIIKQYQGMFMLEGVQLVFENDALEEIAGLCIADKTGARGLRSIIEKKLLKTQFQLPELSQDGVKKIIINNEFIKSDDMNLLPIMVKEGQQETN